MKIEIENFAKKISQKYKIIMITALVLLLALVTVDIFSGFLSQMNPSALYSFALSLGSIGAFFAFAAVIFYPLRKASIHLRKKVPFLTSPFYKTLSKVTAHLHPVIALLAIFILSLPGFIFMKELYNFDFSMVLIMGSFTLIALTFLFITGSVLKTDLTQKRVRRVHLPLAASFIIFFIAHNLFM
ncbi:hypothetical protein [Oceanispirochaeta sp.]|jgi:hypothetical protein|uniref:hypothetical protein n=1 Tax=Oceanispirochaeta sp. TaxID=2035350 RepID=UPI00262FC46E|nr:hypothetical protein [Oceanispirochaeta sp.]MDA3958710.1 hypothetical protein [Oceanispirochaeta sp.]